MNKILLSFIFIFISSNYSLAYDLKVIDGDTIILIEYEPI